MEITFERMKEEDVPEVLHIYNEIIGRGNSFQQDKLLTGEDLLLKCKVEEITVVKRGKDLVGFFILRPNGGPRVAHIGNATYGIREKYRNLKLGKRLVAESPERAKESGYIGMQFNSVLAENIPAVKVYEAVGFQRMAVIPKGFRTEDGFRDTCIYFKSLE